MLDLLLESVSQYLLAVMLEIWLKMVVPTTANALPLTL